MKRSPILGHPPNWQPTLDLRATRSRQFQSSPILYNNSAGKLWRWQQSLLKPGPGPGLGHGHGLDKDSDPN